MEINKNCILQNQTQEKSDEGANMFKYDNNFLVVDELFIIPDGYLLRISDRYYMIHFYDTMTKPIKESAIKPFEKRIDDSLLTKLEMQMDYFMSGTIPRSGFNIRVGRPISTKELSGLCERFNITDDKISDIFDSQKGAVFGSYAKTFKSIELKVPMDCAIPLEEELNNKGIEAANCRAGRIEIRVDADDCEILDFIKKLRGGNR